MLVCLDCGHEFEWGEEAHWEERHGLDPFEGPGEKFTGCPVCGGAFEEVYRVGECENDDEEY